MRNRFRNHVSSMLQLARGVRLRLHLTLFAIVVLTIWPGCAAFGQSQSAPPAQAQSQPQSQPQKPAEPQLQTVPGAPEVSLAEAARKVKAKNPKSSTAKVMTDDDVSHLSGAGVSVVGGASPGSGDSHDGDTRASMSSGDAGSAAPSADNGEKYWRGRAREIMYQIEATEQQIASLKEEIAKAGPASFDPSTGLSQGVIIVHDRNAEMKQLEDRKQLLQKKLEDLADEGRKAGADSSWFR